MDDHHIPGPETAERRAVQYPACLQSFDVTALPPYIRSAQCFRMGSSLTNPTTQIYENGGVTYLRDVVAARLCIYDKLEP